MLENLEIAGLITLIGMSLVFASIVLLWGVMAALVRLTSTSRKKKTEMELPSESQVERDVELYERRRRAAIVAVAVALAKTRTDETPHVLALPPTAIVSAWQAVLRSSNVRQRGPVR